MKWFFGSQCQPDENFNLIKQHHFALSFIFCSYFFCVLLPMTTLLEGLLANRSPRFMKNAVQRFCAHLIIRPWLKFCWFVLKILVGGLFKQVQNKFKMNKTARNKLAKFFFKKAKQQYWLIGVTRKRQECHHFFWCAKVFHWESGANWSPGGFIENHIRHDIQILTSTSKYTRQYTQEMGQKTNAFIITENNSNPFVAGKIFINERQSKNTTRNAIRKFVLFWFSAFFFFSLLLRLSEPERILAGPNLWTPLASYGIRTFGHFLFEQHLNTAAICL